MKPGDGQRRLDARDPSGLEVRSPFRYDPAPAPSVPNAVYAVLGLLAIAGTFYLAVRLTP